MKVANTAAALLIVLMPATAEACKPPAVSAAERSTQEQRAAPISSAATLAAYLEVLPYDSPLLALTEQSRKRFTESLTFSSSGVSGFSFADIQRELTVSQAHALLELIDSQRAIVHLNRLAIRTDLDRSIRTAIATRCAGDEPASGSSPRP